MHILNLFNKDDNFLFFEIGQLMQQDKNEEEVGSYRRFRVRSSNTFE